MNDDVVSGVKLTGVLVEGVRRQSERAAAKITLETAAMEEQALSAQTFHHVDSLLTEETDIAAADRKLKIQKKNKRNTSVEIEETR